ncbi:Hsp20/alpha crystallin family protein [Neobacillus dielmonensis]|uniref:Hsp20/alpha crystallin family protein n=1 Tax=Neobacillus dielmonensis TaxID=1347369 RepID=UPI0005AA9A57|nr:Hsp20/alpha crystallin family protein [Neobacillus dielmonensis]
MFPWNIFPFNKDMKDALQKMKPEEIDKYVQDIISKVLPANMGGMMNPQEVFRGFTNQPSQGSTNPGKINSAAFETHDYVFVRISIKDEAWIKKLKIYHTSNQLIVEHVPEDGDKNTITLPAIVKKKGATANYKDGILEVKIPKNVDMQFSQIDVTEIL